MSYIKSQRVLLSSLTFYFPSLSILPCFSHRQVLIDASEHFLSSPSMSISSQTYVTYIFLQHHTSSSLQKHFLIYFSSPSFRCQQQPITFSIYDENNGERHLDIVRLPTSRYMASLSSPPPGRGMCAYTYT